MTGFVTCSIIVLKPLNCNKYITLSCNTLKKKCCYRKKKKNCHQKVIELMLDPFELKILIPTCSSTTNDSL